jgi:hypothetical protein
MKYFKLTVYYFFQKVVTKSETLNDVSGNPCIPLKTNKENIKIKNWKYSFKVGCLLSFLIRSYSHQSPTTNQDVM